jgi:hypothetical protein
MLNNIIETLKNEKEKKKIFLITIVTAMIVHFQLYALMITGPDTLINSMYHAANVWEVMILRFGLCLVQAIKGNIVSPVLATLISSAFLGITVNLVIDTLKIENKYLKYITAVVFAVAPNVSATLTFFYCSDAYILGMLLATLAVFLVNKYQNKKWIIPISGLLIALSMGMYQTYLSVTMVLCVATLIIDVLNKKEKKEIFISIIRYVLMGVIGVILFYAISHIVVLIAGFSVSDYSGADSIGLKTLLEMPKLLPEAYQSFFNYYFNDEMIPNKIWGTNVFYIVIFAVMLISTIYIIIKNKIYEKISNTILLVVFIAIAPICFGIIEIIVPSVDIHILMACSMIYVFPIFFKILEILPKDKASKYFKYIVAGCSLVIIWNYIWQDNSSYLAIRAMQNQAEATVTRIVTRIEELDGYTPDMPVLFLGGLMNNTYLNRSNTSVEAKKVFDRSWGFIAEESTIWWGNLDSWSKLLYEYTGVNLNLVSEWVSTDIFETEEYKSMKYYPEKDGIKIINGTVVVRLSDWKISD